MTLHIPAQPFEALRPSTLIAEGLLNPRGLCLQDDGSLGLHPLNRLAEPVKMEPKSFHRLLLPMLQSVPKLNHDQEMQS